MKFVCLGYADEAKFKDMPPEQLAREMEECFTYDDELRRKGHFSVGLPLQSPDVAVTLRYKNGQAAATDGPFIETKEQIGGILILEARDMAHAIELMSKHPGVKFGPFEIRPVDDEIVKLFEAREIAITGSKK